MSARLALILTSLLLTPGGCVLPHDLSWEIDWADPALADRAVAVEARILEGGCSSTTVLWAQEAGRGGFFGQSPPDLDEGLYGFAARARDVHCQWFADGCREKKLPGDNDDTLRLVLDGQAPEADCADELCIAGRCACTAPGACGSACVGRDCSCALDDCVMRCTGGDCSCAGNDCYMRCDPNTDCSCTGNDCVMDCAAGSTCTCIGNDCTMDCAAGASCTCLAGGCR